MKKLFLIGIILSFSFLLAWDAGEEVDKLLNPDSVNPNLLDNDPANDNLSNADQVDVGVFRQGYIVSPADVDYFRVTLFEKKPYVFYLTSPQGLNYDLTLIAPGGGGMLVTPDAGSGNEVFSYTPDITGPTDYYLKVESLAGHNSTGITYQLYVTNPSERNTVYDNIADMPVVNSKVFYPSSAGNWVPLGGLNKEITTSGGDLVVIFSTQYIISTAASSNWQARIRLNGSSAGSAHWGATFSSSDIVKAGEFTVIFPNVNPGTHTITVEYNTSGTAPLYLRPYGNTYFFAEEYY